MSMVEEPLEFRNVQPADLDDLLSLRKATMTGHLCKAGLPTDDESQMVRVRYHWEDAKLILLHGEPVGMLKAYRSEQEWVIVQIQIAPAHQGKGLGEKALRTILTRADAEGCPATLSVLKENPARRLYEKLGFLVVEETVTEYVMRYLPPSVRARVQRY